MSLRFERIAAFAALLLFAIAAQAQNQPSSAAQTPLTPQEIAALEQDMVRARSEEKWVELYRDALKLHQQRPYTPEYYVEIIRASAALDRRRTAYHFMLQMQQQGLSYDLTAIEETAGMADTEAFQYMNQLMVEAGQPAGEGQALLDLPGSPADIGDLAWDPTRERFLVGTRFEGKLLAVSDGGQVEPLLQSDEENGLWSIDGIAVDPERNSLWIASTASPAFTGFTPADARRGGLFQFSLDSLELVARFNLDVDGLVHSLGSVAVTQAGDVYVVDRATPMVFRKTADGDRLEPFLAMPRLTALTDIAVTPDNSRLFIADAVMGILLVDPSVGRSALLRGPESLNQFGIYGIEFVDGSLVVTQSGLSPQRIMRFELDSGGAEVTSVAPIAIALEGFDTPGVGTLRGEELFYFANHGSASDDDRMRLWVSPINSGAPIEPPDMRLFKDSMRERLEAEQQSQQDPQ